MIVVLAIDALEHTLVESFSCRNLMQQFHGRTDISEFSEPRTMVLWSSFATAQNREEQVLALGDAGMWDFSIPHAETFFSWFDDPVVIDLPGYSYDLAQHARERALLKEFFDAEGREEKESVRAEYNRTAFSHHRTIRAKFAQALNEDHDFVLGYFSAVDVLGHLNFGNRTMMRMLYTEMDEIAGSIASPLLVLSDHGMEAVGPFGDHSGYGFWSTGDTDLDTPRITEFADYIRKQKEQKA